MKKIIVLFMMASLTCLIISTASPSGKLNYVALGDSVAAGVRGGVSEPGSDKGYADIIAGMLQDAGSLDSFNKEFCLSGLTAKALAERTAVFNDSVSRGYQIIRNADIITLNIGANDLLIPLYSLVNSNSSTDTEQLKSALQRIIFDLPTKGSEIEGYMEVVLQNILNANKSVKIYVMGYYNPFPGFSEQYGADLQTPVGVFNYYIRHALSDIVSKNPGASVNFVDTLSIMAQNSDNLVMSDIHPTEAGHKVIAYEFWKQIKLLIEKTALRTTSAVNVNGAELSFDAYNIEGYNYFRLRDIAIALNGTANQFEVSWDIDPAAINITLNKAYTPVGGELIKSDAGSALAVTPSGFTLYLDGRQASLIAYNIGGYHYIKLRDIAKAVGFGVDWNSKTNTIEISVNPR